MFADSKSAVCTYSRINLIKSDNFAFDTGDKAFPPIVQFGRKENGEVYVVFPNGSNGEYEKKLLKSFGNTMILIMDALNFVGCCFCTCCLV